VGSEGTGKSVIIRSIAIAASQGHHPFAFPTKIPPVRVLLVDLENPVEAILETGSKLMRHVKARDPEIYDEERLKIWRRPGGVNLRTQRDRADLQREIINHQPDLVVMGPVYKMYAKVHGESYEDSADDVMRILDDLRTKYEFALLLEHHAPKGQPGQKRDMSPFGSQRWLAWPELGKSLYAEKNDPRVINIRSFRGDRLAGVAWPDKIIRDPDAIIKGHWEDGMPESAEKSSR
jgi:replicative DNA helicase